jgi:hypothetical protein
VPAPRIRRLSHTPLTQLPPPTPLPFHPLNQTQIKSYYQDNKTLGELGLSASSPIEVKDLGTQFSYRGVFFLEYLGPIVIVGLFALRPSFLFGQGSTPVDVLGALNAKGAEAAEGSAQWNSFVQALAILLWCLHFVKRELET